LLARADGERQADAAGRQFAGRVGLFLRVDDFEAAYQRMTAGGVRFVSPPRDEPYGRIAVFEDLEGNRWDLLGPDTRRRADMS
jgi:predicted enzyme related to lactoylglutathione lyase